eukprot:TRINITY_DN9029_c0_g1_i6.p1 TRINITY_DN9029_c0_g1~~TRINITY_DN9029_c0_g1_i6.p1  ORF type:complete len:117 (+),score=32.80 TRINITY_DN9029_c0_g1_i6:278-628(+)
MWYNYEISFILIFAPLLSYLQIAFIWFMNTKAWKRMRHLLRKLLGMSQYRIFVVVEKDDNPIQEHSCPICLNNLNSQEFIKTPCGHIYHLFCLEEWMKEKSECPSCRQQLLPIEDD